jgi:hypothetical protein
MGVCLAAGSADPAISSLSFDIGHFAIQKYCPILASDSPVETQKPDVNAAASE